MNSEEKDELVKQVVASAGARADWTCLMQALRRPFAKVLAAEYYRQIDDPEDIVQEACLSLAMHIAAGTFRLKTWAGLWKWLWQAAAWKIQDRMRSPTMSLTVEQDPGEVECEEASPLAVIERREAVRTLMVAFAQLDSEDRVVLNHFYWGDLNSTQVAEVLEITPNAARQRKHRAELALVEIMQSPRRQDR